MAAGGAAHTTALRNRYLMVVVFGQYVEDSLRHEHVWNTHNGGHHGYRHCEAVGARAHFHAVPWRHAGKVGAVMTRRELNEARWGSRMVARDRVKVTVARHPVHVVRGAL